MHEKINRLSCPGSTRYFSGVAYKGTSRPSPRGSSHERASLRRRVRLRIRDFVATPTPRNISIKKQSTCRRSRQQSQTIPLADDFSALRMMEPRDDDTREFGFHTKLWSPRLDAHFASRHGRWRLGVGPVTAPVQPSDPFVPARPDAPTLRSVIGRHVTSPARQRRSEAATLRAPGRRSPPRHHVLSSTLSHSRPPPRRSGATDT
jgi:hypothetical protein